MSVLYSPLKYSQELPRNPEMDPNIGLPQQHCHQPNSGLSRYRSAPSTLLAGLVGSSHGCVSEEAFRAVDNKSYLPPSNTEMESMLAKLISSNNESSNSESSNEYGGKPVKQEAGESVPQQSGYSYGSYVIYQPQQVQGLANGNMSPGNGFDGSFGVMNSMALENSTQSKMGSKSCSNLAKQKSSPAGFFSNSSVENGFAALSRHEQSTSTSGFSGHMNFSSRPASCSKRMPQIAENGNIGMESTCVQSRNLGNDNNNSSKCYIPSFTNDFWDNSAYNTQRTNADNDDIMYSTSEAFETQNADFGYQNLGLAHHLSLPSSSTKMSSMEKFLHIQGSVPCKVRAKRGFATHPRSIAERVRRTRISERMKKLQELFPKSDKQTSTADMLDLAVEYIKDLQKQVKILSDTRAKCTCSSSQNQKHYSR